MLSSPLTRCANEKTVHKRKMFHQLTHDLKFCDGHRLLLTNGSGFVHKANKKHFFLRNDRRKDELCVVLLSLSH